MKFSKKILLTIIASFFTIFLFAGCSGCSEGIRVTGIDFGEPVVELKVGDMYQLNAIVAPSDADNQTVLFTSDGALSTNGEEVVLFQRNKKLLAANPGESVITARTQDGSFTAEVKVRVFDKEVKLKTPTNLRLEAGKVVWDKVTYKAGDVTIDADAYIVTLNGVAHEVGGNVLQFESYTLNTNNVVTVQAISNTEETYRVVENSDVSAELVFNKLNAPKNLTREGVNLSWEAVEGASGYQLVINGEKQENLITETSTQIDFEAEGSYLVSVIALPNQNEENTMYQSDPSNEVSIIKLGQVQNVRVEDYAILYDALENATGYIITMKSEDKTYTIDNSTFTAFNLRGYLDEEGNPMQVGDYDVTVVAKNNATQGVDGIPSEAARVVKLSSVNNTQVSSNAFAWSRVNGATGYKVRVDYTYNDEPFVIEYEMGAEVLPSFRLPEDAPVTTYTFSVMAMATGTTEHGICYLSSEWQTSSLTPRKLVAPTEITRSDTTFIFNEVEGAMGYDILIGEEIVSLTIDKIEDGVVYASTLLPSKINNVNELIDASYEVSIRANGGANNFCSDFSEPLAIIVLPLPEKIEIDRDGKVSVVMTSEDMSQEVESLWEAAHVESYGYEVIVEQIRLGKKYTYTYNYPLEEVTFDNIEAGNVTVKARKLGDGDTFISSEYRYLFTKREYELTDVMADEKKITWAPTLDGRYAISVGGNYQELTTNEYIIDDSMTSEDELKVTLYNLGGDNTVSSKGREYTFTRLPSPVVSLEGNTVHWTPVEGASNYRVQLLYNNEVVDNILTSDAETLTYSGYNFGSLGAHQVRVSAIAPKQEENYVFASIDGTLTTNKLGFTEEDVFKVEGETLTWTFNNCGAAVDEIDFTVSLINQASTTSVYTYEGINGNSLNLYEKNLEVGSYIFTIKADYVGEETNNFVNSSIYFPRGITIQVLDAPISARKQGDLVIWEAISGAVSYIVKADYGDDKVIEREVIGTSVDLSTEAFDSGDFTITISSLSHNEGVTDGNYKISSQIITLDGTFTKLTPVVVASHGVVDENYVITIEDVADDTIDSHQLVTLHQTDNDLVGQDEVIQDLTITRPLTQMEAAGTYEFKLTNRDTQGVKISSTSTIVNVVRFGQLANLKIEDGSLIWDNLEGATYEVVISSGENTVSGTTGVNSFDINSVVNNKQNPLPSGNYEIKARAIGDDDLFLTSIDYTVLGTTFNVLPSPTSVDLDSTNKKVIWSAVDGAYGYTLVYNNHDTEGEVVKQEGIAAGTLSADIPATVYAGNWDVTVIAVGNGENIIDSSESVGRQFYKIPAPASVTHVGSTIFIGKVFTYAYYEIKIEYNGSISTYDFTHTDDGFSDHVFDEEGNYLITVKAIGDYISTTDSDYSQPLVINKTTKLANLRVEGEKVKFDGNDLITADNEAYYSVKFVNPSDETDYKEILTKQTEVSFEGVDAGAYNIVAYIKTADNGLLPSEPVTLTNVYKLETPTLLPQLNGLDFTWSMPSGYGGAGKFTVVSYEISVNGQVSNNALETTYELGDEYAEGLYSFKVRAVGDGFKLVSSEFTAVFEISKLAATTVRVVREDSSNEISDYIIKWDEVENATQYRLDIKTSATVITCDVGSITEINIDDLTDADYPKIHAALQLAGNLEIKVIPMGDGIAYANGATSNAVTTVKSDVATAGLKIADGKIVWTQVNSDIKAYVLKVTNVDTAQTVEFSVHDVTEFTLNNSFTSGNYKIAVKGYTFDINKDFVRINTNYSAEIDAYKLATPAQPVLKNGKFTFSTVTYGSDAANYVYEMEYGGIVTQINIEGKEAAFVGLASDTDYQALRLNNNVIHTDNFNKSLIRLRALGDTLNLTSDWSNSAVSYDMFVYGQQLEAVQSVSVSEETLTWTPVVNAKGYHIIAKSNAIINAEDTDFTYVYATTDATTTTISLAQMFNGAAAATYSVTVIATGDTYFTDSLPSSTQIDVTILGDYKLSTNRGLLMWTSDMEQATGYILKIYSYETKDTTYKTVVEPYYTMAEMPAGRYSVSVKGLGNRTSVLDGNFGTPYDVYKISTLTEYTATSTFLNNGDITAMLPTTFADSNAQNKTAGTFLKNVGAFSEGVRAIFTSPDDPNVYTEFILEANIDNGFVFRNITPIILPAGLYNVRFSVFGNSTSMMTEEDEHIDKLFVSSDFTNTVEMIILDTPFVYAIENGILKWNPVSAIVTEYPEMNYVLSINEGLFKDVVETKIDFNVTAPEADKTRFGTGVAGVYTTTVSARGNSTRYLTSAPSLEVVVEVLRHPSESLETPAITLKRGTLSWEVIQNAKCYEIYMFGSSEAVADKEFVIENIVPEVDEYGVIYYELPEQIIDSKGNSEIIPAGTYNVQIRAIGDGVNYLTSKLSNMQEFIRLDSVEGLSNKNGLLVWKHNPSAYYYQLHLVGLEDSNYCDMTYNVYLNASSNEIDGISNATFDEEDGELVAFELAYDSIFYAGTYEIQIRAIGDNNNLISSIYTAKKEFIKLSAPEYITITNGMISWAAVDWSSNGYYLFVNNDRIEQSIVGTSTELPEDYIGNPINSYTVYVQAVGSTEEAGSSRRYLNGARSERINNAKKLVNVSGFEIIDGQLIWDRLNEASGYQIEFPERAGSITENTKIIKQTIKANAELKYSLEGYDPGIYQFVRIKALGGSEWINSNYTTFNKVTKLTSPIVGFDYSAEKILITKENNTYKTVRAEDNLETTHTVKAYEFKVVNVDSGTTYFLTQDVTGDVAQEKNEIEVNIPFSDYGSGKLEIYVRALPEADNDGIMRAVHSNYIEQPIVIEIPDSPSNLRFDSERHVFTWDAVEGSDITYTVFYAKNYKNLINDTAINLPHDDVTVWGMEEGIKTNYFYPSKLGVYTIVVRSNSSGQIYSPYIGVDDYGLDVVITANESEATYLELRGYVAEYGVQGNHNLFASGEGSVENPYYINNVTQFNNIRYYLSSHFRLGGNISFTNFNMEPIGTKEEPFVGSLDGEGYSITGYNYTLNTAGAAGIFGYVSKATISNVTVSNVNIFAYPQTEGTLYLGGLIGWADDTIIHDCTVSGKIDFDSRSPSANMNYYAAGVLAYGKNVIIYGCVNNATISKDFCDMIKTTSYVYSVNSGGIAAYVNGQIYQCINNGSIYGTNYIGGIVGHSEYTNTSTASIFECVNRGDLEAVAIGNSTSSKYAHIGGIVGRNYMFSSNTYTQLLVENCYNIGSITLYGNRNSVIYAGGFAGYSNAKLKGFYTVGQFDDTAAQGTNFIGGIVGRTDIESLNSVDELGNSKSTVVVYHAYYEADCGADVAGGNNSTISMITGTDTEWDAAPNTEAASTRQIQNYLTRCTALKFEKLASEDYPTLEFENE